jgi:hypothetical protein
MTNNEKIFNHINQKTSENIDNYGHLIFEKFNWPILDSVRNEICECLIIGCSQAAITLTNHLLEKSLKMFLFHVKPSTQNYTDAKEIEAHFKKMNEMHGNKDLHDTINNCCTKGLISKDEKLQLHIFREKFRNAFGHAQPDKTFGQVEKKVLVFNPMKHVEIPKPEMVKISDFPFFHDYKQKEIADSNCGEYFCYVDSLIKRVLPNLFTMPAL